MAEIIKCPECLKPLQVPDSFYGQTVQCPECRHQFTVASTAVTSQPAPPTSVAAPRPEAPYDDDRRPEDAPERRSRYDQNDYDDIERSSPPIHRDLAPHRGGVILILGILGLAVCILCGPFAWSMGSTDLAEIRAGRMDPAGEGMVQAGRILGMIATGLFVLQMLAVCFIVAAMMTGM